MRFYARRPKEIIIEGPFPIEELNQLVRRKHFGPNSLVLADNGQDLREVQRTPETEWMKLSDVPGFKPDPKAERKYVLLIVAIILFLVLAPIAAVIYVVRLLRRIG